MTPEEKIYAQSLLQYIDDPMPGYFEMLNKTWISFKEFGLNFEKYPVDPYFTIHMIKAIRPMDLISIFVIAILFVVLRVSFTSIFLKNYSKWLQIKPADELKFSESSWKFLVYLCFWTLEWYILIGSGNYSTFYYPLRTWKNVHFSKANMVLVKDDVDILSWKIPTDIYLLYVIQMGFYMYSIYAVAKFDAWRTDSVMMIVHHFLTLFLLGFSFIMRYYEVGTLVLFLHDIADVVLEFAKCNIYLKNRESGLINLNRWLSNISFFMFLVVWFVFRLYLYPLKVLHLTNWGVYITQIGEDPKMYLVLNTMLFILLILNIYWFIIIVRLAYKISTGQLKEVEDTRETELDEQYTNEMGDIPKGEYFSNGSTVTNNLNINGEIHYANGDRINNATTTPTSTVNDSKKSV